MRKKDAFYFKHDSNARNDEKLLSVRMKYGMEGYGIYWAILEKLRDDPEYMLKTDYALIAWDLHVSEETIESVVNDFGLFRFTEDGHFYSERMMQDMKSWSAIKSARSEAGKKSADARQQRREATSVQQVLSNSSTNVEETPTPQPPAPQQEKPKVVRFVPPTLDEVKAYCQERGNRVNPERWFYFYQSKGWMVGKNKMKDWRSAVRTWERDDNEKVNNDGKRNVIAGADAFGASD